MGLYDSSFVDSTAPEGGYNVTNPQANMQPGLKAAAFRKGLNKNLDNEGNVIDLDAPNMPAGTTQIYNPNANHIRFDENVTAAQRSGILNEMDQKIKGRGVAGSGAAESQASPAPGPRMGGGAGSLDVGDVWGARSKEADPNVGLDGEYRAPMRAYNHTTGEYFEKRASVPRFTSDKVRIWSENIARQNRDAADIRASDAKIKADELAAATLAGQNKFNNEQTALTNASAIKVAEAASAAGVARLNTVTDIMSAKGKAEIAAMPAAEFQVFFQKLPEGATKEAASKVWAAKNNIVVDPGELATEQAGKGANQAMASLFAAGTPAAAAISGAVDNVLAANALQKTSGGSDKTQAAMAAAKNKIDEVVAQLAKQNRTTPDALRPLAISIIGKAIGPADPNYLDIMAYLAGDAPAAPTPPAPRAAAATVPFNKLDNGWQPRYFGDTGPGEAL